MTNREFFVAIANLNDIPQNLVDFANEQVKKLDTKNSNRNAKVKAKKADENAPLIAQIKSVLADGKAHTCAELAAFTGANIPKIAALVKPFVDNGTVVKETVKNGKNKAQAYKNA